MRKLLRRIHYWINHRRAAAELADEIESHRQMRQAQLEQSGLSKEEASFASKRAMGSAVLAAEKARETWSWRWLDDAWRDIVLGLRNFCKSPGFPLGASLILSFGIGVNVAVFQIMDVSYWRPLEIRDSASVFRLFKSQWGGFGYPAAQMFDPNGSVFSSFFMREGFPSNELVWGDDPANRVWASFVSSNWFEELGIQPKHGRTFHAGTDDAGDAPPTIVISELLWKRLLNSDPEIVGKSVRVNNRFAVVIGVVRPDVMPHGGDMLWMPITQFDYFAPGTDFKTSWDRGGLSGVEIYGRLRPGVPPASVRGAMQPLMDEFRRLHPEHFNERDFFIPSPASARFEDPRGGPSLFFLGMPPALHLGLALTILLIVCANLMSLVLSRAMTGVRDLSIRVSLGAGQWRIIRHLMTENALLVFFSSIVSLVFVYWVTQILLTNAVGRPFDLSWRTIAATVVVASITAGAIGLLPAWKISSNNLTLEIKDGGQQASAGFHRTRWRHFLLAAQIGCSCLLLVLAGLILRSLQRDMTNSGFNYDNVAVVTVPLARQELKAEEAFSYWSRMRETLESHPEAESVSLVSRPPSQGPWDALDSDITGPVVNYEVGPGFFSVMKIPILTGREFNTADSFGSAAIISERLAIRMYGSTNVINRPLFSTAGISAREDRLGELAKANPGAIIVGVAADAGLAQVFSEEAGQLYFPLDPATSDRALLVRARSNPAGFVPVMRTAALNLNSNLLPDARLLARDFASRSEGNRVLGTVLAVLAGLALSITCVGIFGTVSYAATLRRREIGIRMALGAARTSMFLLLLKQLRWPLGVGLVFGLAAAIAGGHAFAATPLAVEPFDPAILAIVGGFVLLTAVVAALLPALRAVQLGPMDTLRSE